MWRDSTASFRCTRTPAHLGKAAANNQEAVQGAVCGSVLAVEGGSLPHRLLPLSEAGWDVLYLSCPGSVTRLQSDLSFILQPGLLPGSPACWCHGKWTFGICPPQGPLHTNGLSPAAGCILYLSFSSAPSAHCSTVMPSERAKSPSMDFKGLFKVLDLTAALRSLIIAVSLWPLSDWQKVCTASSLTARSLIPETSR